VLQLEEARARIFTAITAALSPENVPLIDTASRILSQDLVAPIDLPLFDNSAMDGYAVRCEDVKSASDKQPVSLKISAHVPAGSQALTAIKPGECARVFTGSPLPAGTDAVVMQEDMRVEGSVVTLHEAPKPWENVRFRGEDVKAGTVVLRKGERISVGAIGLAGALGIASISVHRQPIVGVLATGDELQEAGEPLRAGHIYESNRAMLATIIRNAGGQPRVFPLVPDTLESTRTALQNAMGECDVVITSGGVSVGELDFIKAAFEKLSGTLDFWRVAIRPGKPFLFGILNGKHLFGLPGNPVSAFVTALLLVRPALLRLQAATDVELPSHLAIAAESFVNKGDRRHFMRVRVDNDGHVHLAGVQASHAVGSLSAANALVDVPPHAVIEAGRQVRVLRFA